MGQKRKTAAKRRKNRAARQGYEAAIADLRRAEEIQKRVAPDTTLADIVRENLELAVEGLRVSEARIMLRKYAAAQS